jgi:hypothetical protein
MKFEALQPLLVELFGEALQVMPPDSFQVEESGFRLLVLTSEAQGWLRLLVPIAPEGETAGFLAQILAANFDSTQQVRYAVHQQVLWGVYHHRLDSLVEEDLRAAIAQLTTLHDQGLDVFFNSMIEAQIRQIIAASKAQGQSLAATLQTLERFYAEGMMGGLDQTAQQRGATLDAWRYQLNRLWDEVEETDFTGEILE